MRLLDAAILRATQELREPIDRVEVTRDHVICSSGSRQVVMSYGYAQGGEIDANGRFMPMPGSGAWEVQVVDGSGPPRTGGLRRAVSRLLGGRS